MLQGRLQGLLLGATTAVLVASCGGGGGAGGGGSKPTSTPAAAPTVTRQAALATATQYFVLDNAAQRALDISKMDAIEEGPLAQYHTAEYNTYAGHVKSYPPYTATGVTVLVPASGGSYPADFLCEATLHVTGSSPQNTIVVFQEDARGAPWRATVLLTFGDGAFPAFSLDSKGYADELSASAQSSTLTATGADIEYAWANLISKPLFGMNAVDSNPAVTFSAGANTTLYLSHLQGLFTGATHSGGSTSGYVNPARADWVYRISGGGGFVIFVEDTQYEIAEGITSSLTLGSPVDTFVAPGKYEELSETAVNVLGAADPPRGSGGGSVSIPYATTDYTAASGS